MEKFYHRIIFFIIAAIICQVSVLATPVVKIIPLKDEVGSTTWRYVQKGLDEAKLDKADAVIIHMNTYGGAVDYADSIRTAIINFEIPIYAFIDNNAASAGALIAIACDSIYMRNGANIGAATVVNGTGEAMPDKYQSYMRSMIRATAQSHGKITRIDANGDTITRWMRDPLIAEAMVDPRTSVPEIGDDSTRVVSFTALEAMQYGFCEAIVESSDEIIKNRLGYNEYQLTSYNPSLKDNIFGFLTNPALQAILIMIMIGGIYFELQTPGMGFPSAAAIVAAILYFLPLYLDGFALGWEIMLFAFGIVMLALEIFVIPGWGFAGVVGIISLMISLLFSIINNDDNTPLLETSGLYTAVATVLTGTVLGVALVIYLSHKIGSDGIFRFTALRKEQNISDGYIGVPAELGKYVGMNATATTVLRPAGKIRIGDKIFDATSTGGFIEEGAQVKVVKYENSQLYVEEIKSTNI